MVILTFKSLSVPILEPNLGSLTEYSLLPYLKHISNIAMVYGLLNSVSCLLTHLCVMVSKALWITFISYTIFTFVLTY